VSGTAKLRAAIVGGTLLAALAGTILAAPAALAATTAPGNLQATATTYSTVTLAWTPATASGTTTIDGYRILVGGVWRSYSYQAGSGQLSGLMPGRTYTIAVQAQDKAGNLSPVSAPLTVTTPADVQSPTTPTGLVDSYSDPSSGVFVLDWNRSSDNVDLATQVQYQIYANGQLVQLASGLERGATVCLDPGSYTFTVRARDRSGNLSGASNVVG